MTDDNLPAHSGRRSDDPEPARPQAWTEAITALTATFGLMVQQGYPVLYALLATLALGLGGTIVARHLRDKPDDPDDSGTPRWAV